jgi:hypothetical protein
MQDAEAEMILRGCRKLKAHYEFQSSYESNVHMGKNPKDEDLHGIL